jgi:hypothetical protein
LVEAVAFVDLCEKGDQFVVGVAWPANCSLDVPAGTRPNVYVFQTVLVHCQPFENWNLPGGGFWWLLAFTVSQNVQFPRLKTKRAATMMAATPDVFHNLITFAF